MSRLPVVCFVLAFAVAASTTAVAAARWSRVVIGAGNTNGFGGYGGGGFGCTIISPVTNVQAYACPIVDNDTILGYTSASAFFSNSNRTQPTLACVTFWDRQGGQCSGTAANNCPNAGV